MEPTAYGITPIAESPVSKLTDYKDMRKDRKNVKKGYNESGNTPAGPSDYGNQDFTSLDRRVNMLKMKHTSSVDQSNGNVFDRLLNHTTITSRIKEKPPIGINEEESLGTPNSKNRSQSLNIDFENLDMSELLWN